LLLEQAEATREPPEDPLLLFSVLYGVFIANVAAFNGDVCRGITAHILELAEKQHRVCQGDRASCEPDVRLVLDCGPPDPVRRLLAITTHIFP
jgi:hypothetical protein